MPGENTVQETNRSEVYETYFQPAPFSRALETVTFVLISNRHIHQSHLDSSYCSVDSEAIGTVSIATPTELSAMREDV